MGWSLFFLGLDLSWVLRFVFFLWLRRSWALWLFWLLGIVLELGAHSVRSLAEFLVESASVEQLITIHGFVILINFL